MPATPKIGIVILAAGESSRMGSPKQLLPFRGKPLIRVAADAALALQHGPVFVVLGSSAADIAPALANLEVRIIENPDWKSGMGSSISAGVAAAEAQDCDGLILTLADQPFVTSEILQGLIDARAVTGKPVVASQYAGTVGVPAYFSRCLFAGLRGLPHAQGCKGLILSLSNETILIACPEAGMDIDTPEQYRAAAP